MFVKLTQMQLPVLSIPTLPLWQYNKWKFQNKRKCCWNKFIATKFTSVQYSKQVINNIYIFNSITNFKVEGHSKKLTYRVVV